MGNGKSDYGQQHDSEGRIRGKQGFDRFLVASVLGEGQHSTVYRAHDPLLERDVALKLPRANVAKTSRAFQRFMSEARALARLHHPRIVPIYEAGWNSGRYYLALALIEGHTLAELISHGPLPFEQGVEIVADLADALEYIHSVGIIHRDVKPANIRLDKHGSVFLMDFGIAYRSGSGETLAPIGSILGTPAYIAPELVKGRQTKVLPASDQYSLGVVLYELLTGQPPFLGSPASVLLNAIHHDPPSLRQLMPKVPRALDVICKKALAKQPQHRYASCRAMADDLRRWLRSGPALTQRLGWVMLSH
jgi:serine/threonine protein kinase